MIFRPNDADSVELYEAVRNECTTEDVKKAAWYLNKFIELEEKKDED